MERNALELKGTHIGWTCPQVKEMVQGAMGGCLFLDEAYALSGGGRDGDRGDSFSDEALRTLLTEGLVSQPEYEEKRRDILRKL